MELKELGIAVVGVDGHGSVLRSAIERAGSWSVTSFDWPELPPRDALARVNLIVLATGGESPPDRLIGLLRERPPTTSLVVIGPQPARFAGPPLWLPAAPPTAVLGGILAQLIAAASGTPVSPWRRKADMLIGNSVQVRDLLHSLDQLAPAQTPVLITGESGVGKELVARALHFCGPRAREPFIAINCGAVPETLFEAELFGYEKGAFTGATSAHVGAFEAADNGTLFLDEIGEMPLAMQVKLLRVLETSAIQRVGSTEPRKVDFRLVTATNRNLELEIKEGRFREDLYYRIHVYPVHVAPLRERPEDIPPIVQHYLSLIALREKRPPRRLTTAALEKLVAYAWPGNVRELVNLLERAVLLAEADTIDAEHVVLPEHAQMVGGGQLLPYRDAKQQFEATYYSQLMRIADGNVSLAAKLAQKTRKEIYDALKRLGLEATAFRGLAGAD